MLAIRRAERAFAEKEERLGAARPQGVRKITAASLVCPGHSLHSRRARIDMDAALLFLKADDAGDEGKKGVVAAHADVFAGIPPRAALADDDVARDDGVAAKFFHAESLAVAIAPVFY